MNSAQFSKKGHGCDPPSEGTKYRSCHCGEQDPRSCAPVTASFKPSLTGPYWTIVRLPDELRRRPTVSVLSAHIRSQSGQTRKRTRKQFYFGSPNCGLSQRSRPDTLSITSSERVSRLAGTNVTRLCCRLDCRRDDSGFGFATSEVNEATCMVGLLSEISFIAAPGCRALSPIGGKGGAIAYTIRDSRPEIGQ